MLLPHNPHPLAPHSQSTVITAADPQPESSATRPRAAAAAVVAAVAAAAVEEEESGRRWSSSVIPPWETFSHTQQTMLLYNHKRQTPCLGLRETTLAKESDSVKSREFLLKD